MNQAELIAKAADMAGLTKKDTERALHAFTSVITQMVATGEEVKLVGFGTFDRAVTAPRAGRNPQTGETIQIPSKPKPKFKPGAVFRREVEEAY